MTDGFYGSGSGSGSGAGSASGAGSDKVPPQASAVVPASAPTASSARVPAPRMSARAYARIYEEQQPRLVAYARSLARNAWTAEDLVAEAHFRVWRRLSAGHEIDNVPAYLMTTVRRLAGAAARTARETPQDPRTPNGTETADLSYGAQGIHQAEARAADPAEQISSVDLLVRVLGDLPERWVRALWLAEAEGQPLETVGRHIGAKQGATAVLLHRAREGMRQAFLRIQTAAPDDPACQVHWSRMPAYVRDTATPRQADRLLAHIDTCAPCRTRLSLLTRANDRLPALIAPALLTFALGGTGKYLLSTTAAGATTGGAAGGAASTAKLPAALAVGAAATGAAIVAVLALGTETPPPAPVARTPVAEVPVAQAPVADVPVPDAPAAEAPAPRTPLPEPPVARTAKDDTARHEPSTTAPPQTVTAADQQLPAEPSTRAEPADTHRPPTPPANNPPTENLPDTAQPQDTTTDTPPEPRDTEVPAPGHPEAGEDDEQDTATPVESPPVDDSPDSLAPPSPAPPGGDACGDAHQNEAGERDTPAPHDDPRGIGRGKGNQHSRGAVPSH
ncbi:sigma-70 family RNA polymerase sigma factor [Streptomyces sp. NPDC018693]|uniref:sigma-70 family RNA polymerase sigma factor n=1 Tax=unclassified Streptomyces TaxID=2593676 RepID=UPI003788630E